MQFVRFGKRNEGNSIQAPIDKDNLNWNKRYFWDRSGFLWAMLIANGQQNIAFLNTSSEQGANQFHQIKNHLNADVKSYFKFDPNGYGLYNGLHKIRIWM